VEFVLEDPVLKVGTTGFARVLTGNNIINNSQNLVNGNLDSSRSNATRT